MAHDTRREFSSLLTLEDAVLGVSLALVTLLMHVVPSAEAEAPSPAPAASPEGARSGDAASSSEPSAAASSLPEDDATASSSPPDDGPPLLEPVALCERGADRALDTSFLALMAAASSTAQVRERALVELVLLFGSLGCRAELHPGCLVHALILVENAIRAGLRFDVLSLRPLAVAAVVLASKYHYDETMHLKDFRDAVPHLKLRRLAQMEVELFEVLRFRLVVWDEAVWTQYGVGLASLLAPNREAVEGVRPNFGAAGDYVAGRAALRAGGCRLAAVAPSVGVVSSARERRRVCDRDSHGMVCLAGVVERIQDISATAGSSPRLRKLSVERIMFQQSAARHVAGTSSSGGSNAKRSISTGTQKRQLLSTRFA